MSATSTSPTVTRSGGSGEGGVEVARPEPFEVERDVPVASAAHRLDDRLAGGQYQRQRVEIDLDAGRVVVVPYSALREAECAQRCLGALDPSEDRHGDGGPVGHAAGEACRSRLV